METILAVIVAAVFAFLIYRGIRSRRNKPSEKNNGTIGSPIPPSTRTTKQK